MVLVRKFWRLGATQEISESRERLLWSLDLGVKSVVGLEQMSAFLSITTNVLQPKFKGYQKQPAQGEDPIAAGWPLLKEGRMNV